MSRNGGRRGQRNATPRLARPRALPVSRAVHERARSEDEGGECAIARGS